MSWQSNMERLRKAGLRYRISPQSHSQTFTLSLLELSLPTISLRGFQGFPCTKSWLSTDGNHQPLQHMHTISASYRRKGLAQSCYFAKLNTPMLHVYSKKVLWPNTWSVSKHSIWKYTGRHGINQDILSETGTISKKFKQDFLKIQRALKDNLQKNPEQLLSNLGTKKTYRSVKIRKRLLTALLRTVNCQKSSTKQNT